jgi:hypothetical protein
MTLTKEVRPRWVPAALAVLSLLTVSMLVVAAGVMFDVLPTWAPSVGSAKVGNWPVVNRVLPIGSSLVGAFFVTSIFRRYAARGGTHLLVWGIGLTFFATGSVTESIHGLFGWHDLVFRFWYLFGAVLIAAWMGQGTVHLLAPAKPARLLSACLVVASAYGTFKVLTAELEPRLLASSVQLIEVPRDQEGDEVLSRAAGLVAQTAVDAEGQPDRRLLTPFARTLTEASVAAGRPLGPARLTEPALGINHAGVSDGHAVLVGDPDWLESHGVPGARQDATEGAWTVFVAVDDQIAGRLILEEPSVFSGHVITSSGVRSLTPFFNIYGIITLIGGAIYSAWVFWRKQIMAHRALGNVLIAGAAILGGGGSAFARFGMLTYLYTLELASLTMMYVGFRFATRASTTRVGQEAEDSAKSA